MEVVNDGGSKCVGDGFSADVYERLVPAGKKPRFAQLLVTQLVAGVWHVSTPLHPHSTRPPPPVHLPATLHRTTCSPHVALPWASAGPGNGLPGSVRHC